MTNKRLLDELKKLGIHDLWIMARFLGIKSASTYKREALCAKIAAIIAGTEQYVPLRKGSGRPAKDDEQAARYVIAKLNSLLVLTPESANYAALCAVFGTAPVAPAPPKVTIPQYLDFEVLLQDRNTKKIYRLVEVE